MSRGKIKWFLWLGLPAVLWAVEMGSQGKFVPLKSMDDRELPTLNENFRRISENQILDRGSATRISTQAVNTVEFKEAQENANYSLVITPNWPTKLWVLQKNTTGYTIEVDSTGVVSAAIDWIMVR